MPIVQCALGHAAVQGAALRKVCQELHSPHVLVRARKAEREEGVPFGSSAWYRLRPRCEQDWFMETQGLVIFLGPRVATCLSL